MHRRKLAAVAGGLVIVVATAVVLRHESAPERPERFVDPSIELVEAAAPEKPGNPRASALDPDTLQLAWSGSAEAYEVRWGDHTQVVTSPEAELTGLDPDDEAEVEIRSVNPVGRRSDPLTVAAIPRKVLVSKDKLIEPIDRFDGPESLDPRQWRVLGDPACLGLRPFGTGKRLDFKCAAGLQANKPLRLGVPDSDGVTGRVMITAAGGQQSHVQLELLPEPLQDLPWPMGPAPGAVSLDLSSQGTRLTADPKLPTTEKLIALGDAPATGLAPDSRHRWEVRIMKDAIVAVRDGVVVAAEAVAVPWTVVRPRIMVEGEAMLDSFGLGGVPEREVPATVVPLREGTDLGSVPRQALEDAVSARLILVPNPRNTQPITVDFGGVALPTKKLTEDALAADLPLNRTDAVVRTNQPVAIGYVVVVCKPGARPGALPRLPDHEPAANKVLPKLTIMHDSGVRPGTQFPPTGRILVTAEIGNGRHEAIQIEVDGKRLLMLPTTEDGPGVSGRHEIWLRTTDFTAGGHRLKLTVLPPDHGEAVTTEAVFEVRATA
ncbi:hypothetical protein Lesp02_46750 [Lentzea sp. NBRC 105346]|uniref:fibronectin type III domain-containing protein n=1 Tax=Lentzea sp. NBRC 105346 TaxID=3032205 RepID=UPI0024A05D9D|nr:fibronectin type III domain-containing protein [Lentzea sp. NBRC 105346]GLZ32487.1 hypothetical protein Lesp02_46750 [Lentzea sp. NBRC 105346]